MDDCRYVGHPDEVAKARIELIRKFECDDVVKVEQYLKCKIYRTFERKKQVIIT